MLTGAMSPVAETVEIHDMTMEGMVMKMRKLDGVAVKAGDLIIGDSRLYHAAYENKSPDAHATEAMEARYIEATGELLAGLGCRASPSFLVPFRVLSQLPSLRV